MEGIHLSGVWVVIFSVGIIIATFGIIFLAVLVNEMLGLSYRMIFIIKEMADSLSRIEKDQIKEIVQNLPRIESDQIKEMAESLSRIENGKIKEMAESLSNIERDVRYIGRDIKISSYTDDVTS